MKTIIPFATGAILLAAVTTPIVIDRLTTSSTMCADTGVYVTADQAIQAVQQGAVDLGTPGWDATYGYGRSDAFGALRAAATITGNPLYLCGALLVPTLTPSPTATRTPSPAGTPTVVQSVGGVAEQIDPKTLGGEP